MTTQNIFYRRKRKLNTQTKNTTEFFQNDYVDYASYDNIRKIPSLIDGQKNAARKILWYSLQKNLKNEIKVSQLDSKVAEDTEYLHGSMAGVIVNLGQNYIGTNNMNLMMPEGNFGTRLVPDASAARYIYTYGSPEMFKSFNKQDDTILEHQYFEGHKIEPKFMLPKLPILLINGAEGISSGYASKILPRDPKAIEKYIKYYLEDPSRPYKPFKNKPFYRGFKGTITQGDQSNKWIISGTFVRKANKVTITELPIGYSLKSYLKVLDKLEDDKKIIGYVDGSNKTFKFIIQFNRKYLDAMTDEKLQELLKLNKRVSENYTVMNQFNRVEVFQSVANIMDEYKKVKKKYLTKRKADLVLSITQEIKILVSKYMFIQGINNNTLIITKRPTEDIIKDLHQMAKIIKVDDSYQYLLSMSIQSLTEERMQKLLAQIKEKKAELDYTKIATIEDMWMKDLDE